MEGSAVVLINSEGRDANQARLCQISAQKLELLQHCGVCTGKSCGQEDLGRARWKG